MENWKDIKGYEGLYQISDKGRVKSLSRKVNDYRGGRIKKETIMNPSDNGNGYLVIRLRKDNRSHYIHRLVAEHFLDKQKGRNYVNHKDFDKRNNNSENLEWCTQRENILYSSERMRKPKSKSKKTNTGEKYIREILKHGKTRFRVYIKTMRICKQFRTLEEAIAYRNEITKKGGD